MWIHNGNKGYNRKEIGRYITVTRLPSSPIWEVYFKTAA